MANTESRGILTETDREWLNGNVDYANRQNASKRRRKIRERVATALQDFAILTEELSAEERQKTIEEEEDIEQSASEIIEFLYVLLNEPATSASKMTGEDAVDRSLRFREALREGIKRGKSHFGDPPNPILIDANTELFETPSVEDFHQEIDTDGWTAANEYVRGSIHGDDDTAIDLEEVPKYYHSDLHLSIEHRLSARRKRAEVQLNRHNEVVQSTNVLPDEDS